MAIAGRPPLATLSIMNMSPRLTSIAVGDAVKLVEMTTGPDEAWAGGDTKTAAPIKVAARTNTPVPRVKCELRAGNGSS